ncbi:MAG: enoyl-ACP reductase [Deltaproteobacteria bacterium]|nr:enoyl-ACP reductase [Deltaproteobacteria bacterium]MBI3387860.1 enoyl-ACP reductase [Deltaproteobacteria bacterium]
MALLDGKKAVILGVANDHSIAWAIAQAFAREGAELALTYAGEAIEKRVRPLAASLGVETVLPCDVTSDEQIGAAFDVLGTQWGGLDIVVHAVAFAQRDDLKGRFIETSRDGFRLALDVSAYSLVAIARAAEPLLARHHGSMLTLSYFGAEKVVAGYNVMGVAKAALEACVRYLAWDLGATGVRVNAISAGPIRTLSAAGIAGFRTMLHHHEERAPLHRNVSADEVARAALFLCSDLGVGVTGEVTHVDAGYNIVGM